jgi:Leu/Phe-tRNA-protein transferase
MITRIYYKDGKIVSEVIPPEDFYLDHTVELRAAIATLTHKLAIAEAALELFSECADEYNSEEGDWLDDHWASHKDNITVGDLRRARTALAAIRAKPTS